MTWTQCSIAQMLDSFSVSLDLRVSLKVKISKRALNENYFLIDVTNPAMLLISLWRPARPGRHAGSRYSWLVAAFLRDLARPSWLYSMAIGSFVVLLFLWAAANWQETTRELATARAEIRALVPADRQLFNDFKAALPKDSPVLAWLRNEADTRMYRRSNIALLSDLIYRWRDADEHFINPELEQAAQRFVECARDFLSYQGSH
jgi:hypothetical protein